MYPFANPRMTYKERITALEQIELLNEKLTNEHFLVIEMVARYEKNLQEQIIDFLYEIAPHRLNADDLK